MAHIPEEEIHFNHAVIDSLARYLSHEELQSSIKEFLEDGKLLIDQFEALVDANDKASLIRVLHTLKGNCRTLGAQHLADYCQLLEAELKISTLMSDFRLKLRKLAPLLDIYASKALAYKSFE